jgi:glutamate-1-semialdehyde 2,1-aminomutase
MAAGIVMLKTLKENPAIYTKLARHAEMLEKGLKEGLEKAGIKGVVNRVGSLLTLFFTENDSVASFEDVMTSDKDRYANFFRLSLEAGIYLAPSQFEAAFISNAHTDEDIQATIAAAQEAMKQL